MTPDRTSRLRWPRDGVAIRVPPRRLAGDSPSCELFAFAGPLAEAARVVAWDALATALPRGSRVVLLVAAEDVAFVATEVPDLSGVRLREALPNLVEERVVGEAGSLHVAVGQRGVVAAPPGADADRLRMLAVVDRTWLAAIQVHVVRSGHRVAAILPESLLVPLVPGAWSLAFVGADRPRCWLRTDAQQAMLLPDDPASAVVLVSSLLRQRADGGRPTQLAVYTTSADGRAFASAMADALGLGLATHASDPFAAWLAGQGPDGGYGAPLSLLAFDGAGPSATWTRWRWAAALVAALVAVQIVGMQVQWGRLRHEAGTLRQQAATMLTTTFPETKLVMDPPLQMSRGLAGLRSSAGRSDPADFSSMMAASARIFAALPSNALRGADYEARALRLRFASGTATSSDERERLTALALQEGYQLRFDAAANAAGEATASLRLKGATS